ncbi:MAG: type I DNA topoisomerase [Thermodesulfobacteriota bacterium]
MSKALVVVESPAKAKTIKKYLGADYEVKASVGHVKDLPKTSAKFDKYSIPGVNLDKGFAPDYEVIPGKEKILEELRQAATKVERILLATDPDREGEAIAWHLSEELNKPAEKIFRVLFNELTENAIKAAVASPVRLDRNKYHAQQARRILDRVVGYRLSPLLWDKVHSGLSAGRVQSVALRLIADRQIAIDTFVPEEYWSITALLAAEGSRPFEAQLIAHEGKKIRITEMGTASELTRRAEQTPFRVATVKKQERTRRPLPPFITSTMQQEASRKLKLTSTRTMRIAQQLYEGIELGNEGAAGLITYMRTDSPRIAPEALEAVRAHISRTYGANYLPPKPHVYKGRKTAQEAHEAIRPTSADRPPEKVKRFLDKHQLALYTLIWNRFVASQMAPAVFDQTTADIDAGTLSFRVSGSVMKFDGFLKIYRQEADESPESSEGDQEGGETQLPRLTAGQELSLKRMSPRQHFTQPPPAYTEASLIKELEEKGIGRPSTYAETVTTIQKRKYVELAEKKFRPTVLGRVIAKLLVGSFPRLLDSGFTAQMESSLDRIEEGSTSWTETLEHFYGPFQSDLERAKTHMMNIRRKGLPSQEVCPECGSPLLLRAGRYGLFLGCSDYPECEYTRNIDRSGNTSAEPIPTDRKCPQCDAPMLIREGKTGQFLSCSRYPECKTALPVSIGLKCPRAGCEGELTQKRTKRGRIFYSCTRYPACDFSMWNKPVEMKCPNPECDSTVMEPRRATKAGPVFQCPVCKHKTGEAIEAPPRKKVAKG